VDRLLFHYRRKTGEKRMRFTIFAGMTLALAVAGCQGPLGSGIPWGTSPLAEPVTFGNAPIVNARAHDIETIVGYKQGQSGSITVESYNRIAIQRAGACLNLRSEVLNVHTTFHHILDYWEELYRMRFAARKGRIIDYVADMSEGTVTASVSDKGSSPVDTDDPTLIFNILLEQLHLGGETVSQDEEILRYRLGDLVPRLRGDDAERAYSLRVAGRSEHEGRQVVVAKAEGHIWANDEPLSIDAMHFFDVATGVAIHSNTQLHHLSGSDANTRVRFIRNLELDPVRRAESGRTFAAEDLAWGECVSQI
jgi:hypothetical protein